MAKVIKETIKISIAVVATVFMTTFVLGVVNGAKGAEGREDYSVYDVPLLGNALRGADALGLIVGEKIKGKDQPKNPKS